MPTARVYEFGQSSTASWPVASIVDSVNVNEYFFKNPLNITSDKWYTLEIAVQRVIQPGLFSVPVQFSTCSRFSFSGSTPDVSRITYDHNHAFALINVQDVPRFIQTAVAAEFQTTTSSKKYGFGQTNVVFFDVQPSVVTSSGAIFYIEISNGFQFTGTCISVSTSGVNYILALEESAYTCAVDGAQPSRIKILRNDTVTKTKFRIKAFVLNPYTVAASGFKVYYYDRLGTEPIGQIISIGKQTTDLFQTTPITITQTPYALLWGFPSSGSHSRLLKSLYVSPTATSPGYYVYNNVKVAFTLSKSAPGATSSQHYRVYVRLQHTGVLDSSITHNLPSTASRGVSCRSQSNAAADMYDVVCDYVGGMQFGRTYFVAAKIWFGAAHTFATSQNFGFGRVTVETVTVAAGDVQLTSRTLFTSAAGETLSGNSFLLASNLRGEDPTSGFKNSFYHTQVISTTESGQQPPEAVAALWSQIVDQDASHAYRGWGIVQQPSTALQSLFLLLKVQPSQFYSGAATTKTQTKMEIYFNHEILDVDSSLQEASKGLQLARSNSLQLEAGGACVDALQCVNYDKDNLELSGRSQLNGIDYNYKELFKGNVDGAPLYGRYTHLCGANKKSSSGTEGTSDISGCAFSGVYDLATDFQTQVIALRRLRLRLDNVFQSYAASDQYALDFVVGLYSGQMSCEGDPCANPISYTLQTQTLIHGYMISNLASDPAQHLRATLVNCWTSNLGADIPTLLRVQGELPTSLIPAGSNALGIFFDSQLQLAFIREHNATSGSIAERRSNAYACSVLQGALHKNSCDVLLANAQELSNNWVTSQGIVVRDFTIGASEAFDILLPVQTRASNPKFLSIAFLKSSGQGYAIQSAFQLKGIPRLGAGSVPSYPSDAACPSFAATSSPFLQIASYDPLTKDLVFASLSSTFTSSTADGWGAGLTVVAKGIDIFNGSLIPRAQPSLKSCYKLSYLPAYNKLPHHALFCPFDEDVGSFGAGTIGFALNSPGLPHQFYTDNLLVYALSAGSGQGAQAFKNSNEIQPPALLSQPCEASNASTVLMGSDAKVQPFTFTLQLSGSQPIPIDPAAQSGTALIEIKVSFNSSQIVLTTACLTNITLSACTFTPANSSASIRISGGGARAVERLSLTLYQSMN